MEEAIKTNIVIDTEKIILSGDCQVHKTELFIKQTKLFAGVDGFISKLAEGVCINIDKLSSFIKNEDQKNYCEEVQRQLKNIEERLKKLEK